MAKKRNTMAAYHRSSAQTMNGRLASYPLAEWLAQMDGEGDLLATQEEDFPLIERRTFIQDLHNLARRATTLAWHAKEEQGWVVRTSVRGLPETDVLFVFARTPFDQCPSFRKPYVKKAERERAEAEGERSKLLCNGGGRTGWHSRGLTYEWCPDCNPGEDGEEAPKAVFVPAPGPAFQVGQTFETTLDGQPAIATVTDVVAPERQEQQQFAVPQPAPEPELTEFQRWALQQAEQEAGRE